MAKQNKHRQLDNHSANAICAVIIIFGIVCALIVYSFYRKPLDTTETYDVQDVVSGEGSRSKFIVSENGEKYVDTTGAITALEKEKYADEIPRLLKEKYGQPFNIKVEGISKEVAYDDNGNRVPENDQIYVKCSSVDSMGQEFTFSYNVNTGEDTFNEQYSRVELFLESKEYLKVNGVPYDDVEILYPQTFNIHDRLYTLDDLCDNTYCMDLTFDKPAPSTKEIYDLYKRILFLFPGLRSEEFDGRVFFNYSDKQYILKPESDVRCTTMGGESQTLTHEEFLAQSVSDNSVSSNDALVWDMDFDDYELDDLGEDDVYTLDEDFY